VRRSPRDHVPPFHARGPRRSSPFSDFVQEVPSGDEQWRCVRRLIQRIRKSSTDPHQRRAVDFDAGSVRSNSPGSSGSPPAVTIGLRRYCRGRPRCLAPAMHPSRPEVGPWNRRSASLGRVSTPLSASPTAQPAGPETWVPAARDNHAERCDRLADHGRPRARRPFPSGRCGGCPSVVSVPSGPAVPLPQGANRWRSSPEGGLR